MSTARHEHAPVVLVVRDGWGTNPHREHDAFNAVKLARTPVAERLEATWPTTSVITCGEDVGLPPGTMGNSEVGHQNIGAGRIVDQQIMRITNAVRDGAFDRNVELLAAFAHVEATGGVVHLLGLVSNGRVHSDLDHLLALVDLAATRDLPADRLAVHAFMDGRDTGPRTGLGFIERLEARLRTAGVGHVATVTGRYYAMDRDHRWDRVAIAYACLTGALPDDADLFPAGVTIRTSASASDAVRDYYETPLDAARSGDEFVHPTRVVPPGGTPTLIGPGDAVIFFNFRGDRPREITSAFVLDDGAWGAITGGGFARGSRIRDLRFCTFTAYEESLPVHVAFPRPAKMAGILGRAVADHGLTQLRCAETEKFPHVTFFFNDYREAPFDGERRVLVPSPRDVTTYDQKPEMSAHGVRDAVLERLDAHDAESLFIVNFANADMVGHTGKLDATVQAVEVVDACVGAIVDRTLARGGALLITADHGNAEQMHDPATGSPHTAHTVYDVPLTVAGAAFEGRPLRRGGRLGDIAPTILEMMGFEPPAAMTGESLLGVGNPV